MGGGSALLGGLFVGFLTEFSLSFWTGANCKTQVRATKTPIRISARDKEFGKLDP